MYLIEDFKGHLLKETKSKYVPGMWIFFDSETHTETNDLIESQHFSLGWTCYWNRWSSHWPGFYEWKFWDNEEEVCKYFHEMCRREKQVILVGHNIFFDLQACGFFKYFTDWKWKLDFIYDKGLTYILRCKRQGKTLTILSTTNWFDQSLEKLGEVLGLKKGKVDFKTATKQELKVYCRRDVEILVEAMKHYITFLRTHRLGKFSLTKASQAANAYRHRFMDHKIMLHKKPEATLLEREAYMGGRVECFRLGEQKGGPFVSLDVNKMYPFVMKIMEYPWELVEYNSHLEIDRYSDILKSHCVIAEVEIDTPEPAFAVQVKGKTIFPIGKFNCFLCTTGMQYALGQGYIKKIIRSAVYRKADLFSEYVDYIDNIRIGYKQDNNEVMELLCKYMHNGLYGKFAEKEVIREEYDEYTGRNYWKEEVLNIDTGAITIMTKLMNKFIMQYSEKEGKNAFPAIAAHVTENARFVLWEIICGIGRGRVLYCDTDSIKIRKTDMVKVQWPMDKTNLGALKIEDASEQLYIGGAKNYRTEKYRKIKGIPEKATEIAPNVFTFTAFRRQDAHLRQGQITGVQTKEMTRVLTCCYDKGIVHDDGRVTPFRF
jgi:hypothetical protein